MTVETVLPLHKEKHFDVNVRHFHEKLREEHGRRFESQAGQAMCHKGRRIYVVNHSGKLEFHPRRLGRLLEAEWIA